MNEDKLPTHPNPDELVLSEFTDQSLPVEPTLEPVDVTEPKDSTPQNPTDLSTSADTPDSTTKIASETVPVTSNTYSTDDTRDLTDAEQERKKIVDKNLKALQKRFGETFVKGMRLDSGEFAGGGARELLSAFMDIPDFAEKVKQLIPNKYGALDTLTDNQDYILAWLEDAYKDDRQITHEEPRDPYELAKVAGYELTGPFDTVEDFAGFAKDFRQGERICTFNNPQARLEGYHILWLRSGDVDDIPPADELTQENITESWKAHLKTIGRYDAESDSYNLEGLMPSRQDPYGVSSMSVQISRRGGHVSIKNRYNHSVSNPDSTFGNDLDFIAYGLKRAVYHEVGREDLLYLQNAQPANGYVLDNSGGLHKYLYESENIYFGEYEYIENGEVKAVDRGAFDMLSPELYISKSKDGKIIDARGRVLKTAYEVDEDGTQKLHIYDGQGRLQQTYSFTYNEQGKAENVSLIITKEAWISDITNNPALTSLSLAEGASVGNIYGNSALTSLSLAEDASAGEISDNPTLTSLSLAERSSTRSIYSNPALTSLSLAEGASTRHIYSNPALTSLSLVEGTSIGDITGNHALTSLSLAEGTSTGDINYNPALASLNLAERANTRDISGNPVLASLSLAEGTSTRDIFSNSALTSLSLAEGASARDIFSNPALTSLSLAEGSSTRHIYSNPPDLLIKHIKKEVK